MDLKETGLGVGEFGVSESRQGPMAGYGEHGRGSDTFYKQRGISWLADAYLVLTALFIHCFEGN